MANESTPDLAGRIDAALEVLDYIAGPTTHLERQEAAQPLPGAWCTSAEARKKALLEAKEKVISAMLSILAGGSRERVVVEVMQRLKTDLEDMAEACDKP